MKNIYQNLVTRLLAEVPQLKWIDLDKGQMNFERPPIAFPAALINLQLPKTEFLNEKRQIGHVQITIKCCFDFTGNTDAATPETHRNNSLAYFDLIETVYQKLQGWGTADMNPLNRINQFEEQRPDAYKVSAITFTTEYHDFTAAP